jgi:hypothetical protein
MRAEEACDHFFRSGKLHTSSVGPSLGKIIAL